MAEMQNLIYKSECVLSRIRTLLYTKFTEENQMEMDNEVTACLEEYCDHLIQVRSGESTIPENDVIFLDEIFNDIFTACRELHHIYERQKVIEQFQLLKQKFFQVSTMDTCKNYVKNLQKEAEEFNKNLKANPYLKKCCPDLLEELEDFIRRIQSARKNVNLQVGMEAVTGVLTLGTSAAACAVGIVGAVARTGTVVADGAANVVGGAATAAGGATKGVAKSAKVASVAMDAIETAASTSGQVGLPASKSIAATINSSKLAKVLMKSVDAASGAVSLSAKVTDLLVKTNISSEKKKCKKTSEITCFNVGTKVLSLPVSFVDDRNFCSTILAIAIFESQLNI